MTQYGYPLIAKSKFLSSLIYSASVAHVPRDIFAKATITLFKFLRKNKRDKFKWGVMYQEYDKGGLRMIDIDVIIKSLRLAWIPRLLQNNKSNWKTDPEHFFRRCNAWSLLSVKVPLPYKASSKPTKF